MPEERYVVWRKNLQNPVSAAISPWQVGINVSDGTLVDTVYLQRISSATALEMDGNMHKGKARPHPLDSQSYGLSSGHVPRGRGSLGDFGGIKLEPLLQVCFSLKSLPSL